MSDADITSNKVREQVEFYFSDSNLPKDKFLRSLVANNPEGYVELKTIASFNRMKEITTDMDLIVSALKKSSMLEVDAEGKLVRRITALPEVDTSNNRTLYAKGFPMDEMIANLDTIKSCFEAFGKVVCVRARREKNGTFKGSAFIEFDSESMVNELAGKTDIKFRPEDEPLLLESKQQHYDRKRKEREEVKQKKTQEKKQEDVSNMMEEFKQNCFLHIEGIEADEKFGFGEFSKKLPINKKNGLKFIDYPLSGDKTKAILRVESKEIFDSLKQQFDEGKIELPGKPVAKELPQDELEKYISATCEAKIAESNKNKRKGYGGRGGGRGGRGGRNFKKKKTE